MGDFNFEKKRVPALRRIGKDAENVERTDAMPKKTRCGRGANLSLKRRERQGELGISCCKHSPLYCLEGSTAGGDREDERTRHKEVTGRGRN